MDTFVRINSRWMQKIFALFRFQGITSIALRTNRRFTYSISSALSSRYFRLHFWSVTGRLNKIKKIDQNHYTFPNKTSPSLSRTSLLSSTTTTPKLMRFITTMRNTSDSWSKAKSKSGSLTYSRTNKTLTPLTVSRNYLRKMFCKVANKTIALCLKILWRPSVFAMIWRKWRTFSRSETRLFRSMWVMNRISIVPRLHFSDIFPIR